VSKLRISEIFYSLQGESRSAGFPTVFVRLTGCPLRCHYCDTPYAFKGGEWMSDQDVLDEVESYQPHYVTVTGGEPLVQKEVLPLLTKLCDQDYEVSLETSGSMPLDDVDSRVVTVMDIKTPGSGEVEKNRWSNLKQLSAKDQVKFVLCDRADYDWAKQQLQQYPSLSQTEILFSPVQGRLSPTQLADWIVQDSLPVRFQLQLHKILWGDEPGR
jgi:7-carboxy-7-deazaguanine synthase